MFYIHRHCCISPQETFTGKLPGELRDATDNKMYVAEPAYKDLAPGMLRRLGKAARIGIGAAMPVIQNGPVPDGIIIGTANGGMEESIRFLKQIVEYNEDMLAPGSFVQSTANAIASQLGMILQDKGYNITHVHKAHAFENAMLDAAMLLKENPSAHYILGGVDEIGTYNYNIERGAGWYKDETITAGELYTSGTKGTIAGEGSVMFHVSNGKENAVAAVRAIQFFQSEEVEEVKQRLQAFIATQVPGGEMPDLFLTGENGDSRYTAMFSACETLLDDTVTIARYKHICGEYPTASAFALWLACTLTDSLPGTMIKKKGSKGSVRKILIYNLYQGVQHSFMLVEKLQ